MHARSETRPRLETLAFAFQVFRSEAPCSATRHEVGCAAPERRGASSRITRGESAGRYEARDPDADTRADPGAARRGQPARDVFGASRSPELSSRKWAQPAPSSAPERIEASADVDNEANIVTHPRLDEALPACTTRSRTKTSRSICTSSIASSTTTHPRLRMLALESPAHRLLPSRSQRRSSSQQQRNESREGTAPEQRQSQHGRRQSPRRQRSPTTSLHY